MLIWVPANWVATEPEALPNADVEVVALGRDMGQAGDVGDITIPDSVAGGRVLRPELTEEVGSGRLRAALDVTDPEPLPPGHPLWSLSGVFMTPHVAASTPLSRRRAARLVREQAAAYARGGPLRNVIGDAY